MNVLFIVLNDLAYLDEILEEFVALKVRGATIIDSEGMAAAILKRDDLAVFNGGLFKVETKISNKI